MRSILLLITVINCSNSVAQEQLVKANNNFALQIYTATRSDFGNFFISPFSLSVALGMANEGAATTTRSEIDRLLSTSKLTDRPTAYAELLTRTLNTQKGATCFQWPENKNTENKLLIANSLWVRDDAMLKGTFKEIMEKSYSSDLFQFNKNNIADANQRLSIWISEKTSGKIKEMALDPDTKVSIINAIYFMGEWQIPFDKRRTKEKFFHTLSKEKVKMNFMNMQSHFSYYEDSDTQTISIPYNCDEFRMIILLPKERFGISALEKKLTAAYFAKVDSSYSHEVILSIPKFKIESEIFPISNIQAMGYTRMFSDSADFSKMSNDSLKIGNIIHKTFIEIDETRTEAAAVTEVDMVIVGGGGDPLSHLSPRFLTRTILSFL